MDNIVSKIHKKSVELKDLYDNLISLGRDNIKDYLNDLNQRYNLIEKLEKIKEENPWTPDEMNELMKLYSDQLGVSNNPTAQHNFYSQEMKDKISQIEDIFGLDMGKGFIARCLEHFHNNVETTISILLEDNLPPSLRSLNKKMTIKEAIGDLEVKKEEKVTPRVLFENIDESHYHIGKKEKKIVLQDKEEIKKFKERILEEESDSFNEDDFEEDMKTLLGMSTGSYDDEPDDSLNQFESYTVIDGNEDKEESEEINVEEEDYEDVDINELNNEEGDQNRNTNNQNRNTNNQNRNTNNQNRGTNNQNRNTNNQKKQPQQRNQTEEQQEENESQQNNQGRGNRGGGGGRGQFRGRGTSRGYRGTSSHARQSKEKKSHNRKQRGDKKRNIKF